MNELLSLQSELAHVFPTVLMSYDPSETPTGSSWLDIKQGEQLITVEWKPSQGYGLYFDEPDSYGFKPSEIYRNKAILLKRITMILKERKEELTMKEIRELLGVTQQELAVLLGQQQSSVSKMENRDDIFLTSMFRFIQALGGKMEIKVHFEDCDIPLHWTEKKNGQIDRLQTA